MQNAKLIKVYAGVENLTLVKPFLILKNALLVS